MPFFKDFNKDVKDLLTKNYNGDAWKFESKYKGPEKTVFVNPTASSKGLSVDVQYNAKPFKTTTNVSDKGAIKPKVTYDKDGHKVEVSVDKDIKYEVAYEGKFGPVVVHDKLTNAAVDAYVSYAFAPFSVGGGAAYSIEKGALKGWSAGVHYADKGIIADVTTEALKTYTTGVLFPLNVADKKFTIAAQTTCGGKSLLWAAGVEGGCLVCPAAKFRAKIDQDFKVSLAHISKFADNWKAALSFEIGKDKKFGVTFTRE